MSKIDEAIKLLKKAEAVFGGSLPPEHVQLTAIKKAIALLESEPGGFTKTLRRIAFDENRQYCNTQAIKLEDRHLFVQAADEIDRLYAENKLIFKRMGHEADRAAKLDVRVEDLTAELKAKEEEILGLKSYYRFYTHIENHLKAGDQVICKICGKTMEDIEQTLEGD